MNIRRFKKNDAKRCCEIINITIQTMDGINKEARELIKSKNTPGKLSKELNNRETFVYEKKGLIAGLGCLDGNEIKRVYIDPRFQKQGIGSAIIKRLEKLAREKGLKTIIIQASPSSEFFYQKLGYKSRRKEKLSKGKAIFEFINMEKTL